MAQQEIFRIDLAKGVIVWGRRPQTHEDLMAKSAERQVVDGDKLDGLIKVWKSSYDRANRRHIEEAVRIILDNKHLAETEFGVGFPSNFKITDINHIEFYCNAPGGDDGVYDVFISYKSEDHHHAKRVNDLLVQAGMTVFFSRETLPILGQSEYHEEIDRAIEHSKHMVVVGSAKEHFDSKWVKYEWRLFLGELLAGRKTGNLISALAGDMQSSDLPISLRNREAIPLNTQELKRLVAFLGGSLPSKTTTLGYPDKTGEQHSVGPLPIGNIRPGENGLTLMYASGRTFQIVCEDLLMAKADAIVNPANSGLSFGGGLSARISKEAGPELETDRDRIISKLERIPSTYAVPTRPGWLPFRGIVHAVGPRMGDGDERNRMAKTIRNCLYVAHKKQWRSIAFPAIGTGLNGIPMKICLKSFQDAVGGFFDAYPDTPLMKVVLCLTEKDLRPFEILTDRE